MSPDTLPANRPRHDNRTRHARLPTDDFRSHWDSDRHYNVTTIDAERRRLSQLPLTCLIDHFGNVSEIERGFDNYVRCPRGPSRPGDFVSVQIQLQQPDVFCSIPLYRSASVRFDVSASVSARWGEGYQQGSGTGDVTVNGTIDVVSRGFMSCRRFDQMIGERIGAIAVQRIDEFLRTN